jgi:hypothetical protein
MSFTVAIAIAAGALVLWSLAMVPAWRSLRRKRQRLASLRRRYRNPR